MKMQELKPNNGQKSFYGKAKIYTDAYGNTFLKSYDTIVAFVTKTGEFKRLWDAWSVTTAKHINAFRALFGLDAMNKKEWMQLDVVPMATKVAA